MRSVKLLSDLTTPANGLSDRWYVTTGEEAMGPMNLEFLRQGVESGKIPLDCFVRNEAWTVWCPLSDVAVITVADIEGQDESVDINDLKATSSANDVEEMEAVSTKPISSDTVATKPLPVCKTMPFPFLARTS